MKKILALVLAAAMLFALAACAGREPEADYSFADGDQYDEIGGKLNILN